MAQGIYSPRRVARVDVGGLVIDAWKASDLEQKEAAILAEWDHATLSRALRQQAPLDLWKMTAWPLRFWQAFLPLLGKALITTWWEGRVDLEMAKASLRDERKKESA